MNLFQQTLLTASLCVSSLSDVAGQDKPSENWRLQDHDWKLEVFKADSARLTFGSHEIVIQKIWHDHKEKHESCNGTQILCQSSCVGFIRENGRQISKEIMWYPYHHFDAESNAHYSFMVPHIVEPIFQAYKENHQDSTSSCFPEKFNIKAGTNHNLLIEAEGSFMETAKLPWYCEDYYFAVEDLYQDTNTLLHNFIHCL